MLISYLPGIDPPCGDITYTQMLLAHPPAGVEYETYADAIKRGTLIERGKRSRAWREPVLTVGNKAVNVLRQRRLLFWEPFRFFSIQPGAYDLVHMHVFAAAFAGIDCPLVLSSGAPQPDLYIDRRGYMPRQVNVMGRVEKKLLNAFGVNSVSYHVPQAQKVLVYTDHFRDYLIESGHVTPDRVDVVPIFSVAPPVKVVARQPQRIGFVARDFEEKGGSVLLDAFERVRRSRPGMELWIVGSKPQLSPEEAGRRGITWLDSVPRERLLGEIMPSFDVFAYPTPHDCFSYVMLEAMSCGCAIATSDYVSMPEAVDYGRAGLISPVGDAEKLAENVIRLLDPETNLKFRQAARRRFDEHFSWEAVAPRILAAYNDAIARHGAALAGGHGR